MKIYTVLPAPSSITESEYATVFLMVQFEPETYIDEADATEAAQRLASQHVGVAVWIVEGEATCSFRCEPLPVVKSEPTIQHLA